MYSAKDQIRVKKNIQTKPTLHVFAELSPADSGCIVFLSYSITTYTVLKKLFRRNDFKMKSSFIKRS